MVGQFDQGSDHWVPFAVEQTASGYEVAWKVTGGIQYGVWTTDSTGNFISGTTGVLSDSSTTLQSYETSFHQDLNGDGVIGPPPPPATPPLGLASTTANFADNFNGGIYGTDGPGHTSYSLTLTGSNVASGLFALDNTDTTTGDGDGIGQGQQIVLNQVGNVITGSVGGADYFTISIDPATGVVTFTQLANIWHSDPNNPDDPATLTLSNASLLQVVQTVTDADGDSATASINLGAGVFTIQDDGPAHTNASVSVGEVFEDGLSTGNPEGAPGSQPTVVTITHDDLAALVSFGTDGPGTFGFNSAANGMLAGVSSDGSPISYQISGDTLSGITADSRTIFTIHDNHDGGFTFRLLGNLDHLPLNIGGGDSETLTLNLASAFSATDGDGDRVPLGGALNVVVENDIPIALNDSDSTGVASVATGNVITGDSTTGGLGGPGADHVGADSPGRIAGIVGTGGTDNSADPVTHTFEVDGSLGHLSINENGDYVYTRSSSLGGTDQFTYTLTDADGDSTTATLTINLDAQTTPLIAGNAFTGTVEEEQLGHPIDPNHPSSFIGNEDTTGVGDNDTGTTPPGSDVTTNITTGSITVTGGTGPVNFTSIPAWKVNTRN